MSDFRVIQGCPVGKLIAPYIAIVTSDAHATVNSIYRGDDARAILNHHGKHSQTQLWELYQRGEGNPANPPGFSTHEVKSDGYAYRVKRGDRLPWWCQGFDVNDSDVHAVIRQASSHGWHLFRPYPLGVEYHHLNFRTQPRPTVHTLARIHKLRRALPRS